jgi:dolichyl-phosphate beta-glucosyltransferase
MTTPSAGGEKFKDSLSVVIPTYKEARRLPATLRAVVDYLESRFESFEVIVVDDNSPDGTGDIVRGYSSRRPHVRLLVQPGRIGKGAALRRGCLEARGAHVLFMDADHATPIGEVEQFLPHLAGVAEGAVAGVRTYQEGESRARRIVGLLCQLLAHLIVFRKAVVDSQCGFKLFSRAAAQRLFSHARVNGGMIDVELFALMHRFGIPCRYVPVSWHNQDGSRVSFVVSAFRDPMDMIKIRLRDVAGIYRSPVPPERQPWAGREGAGAT